MDPPPRRLDSEEGELEEFSPPKPSRTASGSSRNKYGRDETSQPATAQRPGSRGDSSNTRHVNRGRDNNGSKPAQARRASRSESSTNLSVQMDSTEVHESDPVSGSNQSMKPRVGQKSNDKLSAMRAKLLEKKRQLQKKQSSMMGSKSSKAPTPKSSSSASQGQRPYSNGGQSAYKNRQGQNYTENSHSNSTRGAHQARTPAPSKVAGSKRKANPSSAPGAGTRKAAKSQANSSASSAKKNTSKTAVPVLKKPMSGPLRNTTKGVCWAKTEKDLRNSTTLLKEILRSALGAQMSNDKVQVDAQLKALDKAKNWEKEYAPFVSNVLVALAKDHKNAVKIAQEGVRTAQDCFSFIRDGQEIPLLQAMDRYEQRAQHLMKMTYWWCSVYFLDTPRLSSPRKCSKERTRSSSPKLAVRSCWRSCVSRIFR